MKNIVRDAVDSPVEKYKGCLLSEYQGYSFNEVEKLHSDDEVVQIVTKSNKNIQIYFKRKIVKREEIEVCPPKKIVKKKKKKKKSSAL